MNSLKRISKMGVCFGVLAMLSMAGCTTNTPSRGATSPDLVPLSQQSALIADLAARQSAFPPESREGQIARAVTQNTARATSAELRAAELRAAAVAKNWLPGFQPRLSLDDLGAMVAELAVEQVLFDNGRRKALRDVAAAELDIAATEVSIDANERIHDALTLEIEARHQAALAHVAARAVTRVAALADLVEARAQSGYGDPGDGSVIALRLAEMQNLQSTAERRSHSALAELEILAGRNPERLHGRPASIKLPDAEAAPNPLGVMRATAEQNRTVAEARAARAGLLPRIGVSGQIARSGDTTERAGSLTLDTEGVIGAGTGDALAAQNAAIAAAERALQQASEDAKRSLLRARADLAEVRSSLNGMDRLIAHADQTASLHAEQFREGRRGIVEVVGSFETLRRLEAQKAELAAEAARAELAIARELGVLINGREL